MSTVTIALSKGRIFDETLPLLEKAGIVPLEHPDHSRKLIIETNRRDVRLLIIRATDTPTYVRYGAADIGIAGRDVLYEADISGLYQPIDLNIAKCKMMVAVHQDANYEEMIRPGARLKIATKYVRFAREHFSKKGIHVNIIKLYGSMELAPLVGLSDAIVDLVSTGDTLRANHLKPVEHVMNISSRLIVNEGALKTKRQLLQPILEGIEGAASDE